MHPPLCCQKAGTSARCPDLAVSLGKRMNTFYAAKGWLPYPHVFLYIKPAVQATYGKSRKVKNRFFDSFKTERNTLS
jgi:hypothetical protein